METLRCLTCQGQSIADSDASMAGDMRSEIRTRIAAGESPGHIRQWLMARYGDYISYEPRVTSVTWPLFALPIALLALGLLIVVRRMRRPA
jgi:cytochrome c-type biogenesis protein CcmH